MRDAPLPKQRPFRLKPVVIPERIEQEHLARWLDYRGHLWCHVGNGGKRDKITGAMLRRSGVKRGVPDVLIFTPCSIAVGAAVELKRNDSVSKASPEQVEWLRRLAMAGWQTKICAGSTEAIQWLLSLGY